MATPVEFQTSSFERFANYGSQETESFWKGIKNVTSWLKLAQDSSESSGIGNLNAGASLAAKGFSVTNTFICARDTVNNFSDWWHGREVSAGEITGIRPGLTKLAGTIACSCEVLDLVHAIKAYDFSGSMPEIDATCTGFATLMFASQSYDDVQTLLAPPTLNKKEAKDVGVGLREQVTNDCAASIISRNMWKVIKRVTKLAICALLTASYIWTELVLPSQLILSLASIALISGTYEFSRSADIRDHINYIVQPAR
ncbi:MAG: hypothetical protein KAR79_04805 [Simkaniaceae bacterium]|nr:hypothetical protein [Simkaniaceae bacterium]